MHKANTELRAELRAANIPFWAIAEKLGVHENTVIRRMRTELSSDDRKAFEKALAELKKQA